MTGGWSNTAEALHRRNRLEHRLGTARLEPVDMPASALLVVREVRDPIPGRLFSGRNKFTLPLEWERALRTELESHYRHAVRPIDDQARGVENAVLFRDRAELLACYARDWLRGLIVSRWWWRALRESPWLNLADTLTREFLKEPHVVPAALELLSETGDATVVVSDLRPEQARQILLAVADAFGLSAIQQAVLTPQEAGAAEARYAVPMSRETMAAGEAAEAEGRPDTPRMSHKLAAGWPSPGRSEAQAPVLRRDAAFIRATPPPWRGRIPARVVPENWPREPAALLGVALLLRKEPAWVRSRLAAERFAAWYGSAPSPKEAGPKRLPATSSAVSRNPRSALGEPDPAVRTPGSMEDFEALRVEFLESPRDRSAPERAGALPVAASADQAERVQAEAVRPGTDPSRPQPAPPTPDVAERSAASPAIIVERAVDTEVGGVLYLIHLLAEPEFSPVVESDFGMGGWAWLEIFGRAFAGLCYRHDPLFTALRELEGKRPGAVLGKGFPRLRPLRGRGRREHRQLLQGVVSAPLLRFILPILSRARVRLEEAIGPDSTPEEVMLVRGAVSLTRTHVDLFADMSQANLSARLAGLDRNPGWVASLGRVVTFHFT